MISSSRLLSAPNTTSMMNKYNGKTSRRLRALSFRAGVAMTSGITGYAAVLAALSMMAPTVAQAQSNTDGAITGTSAASKTEISILNLENGIGRTVLSDSNGQFRAGALPPGTYKISYKDASGAIVERETTVVVGSSSSISFSKDDVVTMAAVKVSGYSVNPVDFQTTESASVFTDKVLSVLPVAQSINAVALLAPGTTKGSSFFGDLVSFGGSSVSENAYYVNGFNVSNFRNGLDPSTVPFEFYSNFEIKTGAYSAEFGRSTGGVVNTTTKYGTNEYKGGFSVYYAPDKLRRARPSSYYTDTDGTVLPYTYNEKDTKTNTTANIYASGPLWKDHLFFYGLYSARSNKVNDVVVGGTKFDIVKDNDPFWGVKVDFYPIKNHHIEFTGFSDKSTETTDEYDYNWDTKSPIKTDDAGKALTPSSSFNKFGGLNKIFRYTGNITEDFTLSALMGQNRADRTSAGSEDSKAAVYDTRTGHADWLSGNPLILTANGYDTRTSYRIDAEYAFQAFGSHRLRGGWDSEDNKSTENSVYSGGVYYRYYTKTPGSALSGGVVPAGW